jgi:hypothetical protein
MDLQLHQALRAKDNARISALIANPVLDVHDTKPDTLCSIILCAREAGYLREVLSLPTLNHKIAVRCLFELDSVKEAVDHGFVYNEEDLINAKGLSEVYKIIRYGEVDPRAHDNECITRATMANDMYLLNFLVVTGSPDPDGFVDDDEVTIADAAEWSVIFDSELQLASPQEAIAAAYRAVEREDTPLSREGVRTVLYLLVRPVFFNAKLHHYVENTSPEVQKAYEALDFLLEHLFREFGGIPAEIVIPEDDMALFTDRIDHARRWSMLRRAWVGSVMRATNNWSPGVGVVAPTPSPPSPRQRRRLLE